MCRSLLLLMLLGLALGAAVGCAGGHGSEKPYLASTGQEADLAAVGREMADAARRLVASLDEQPRSEVLIALDSEERMNWGFTPRPRKGLPLKEMDEAQRDLVHALLRTGLSQRGHLDATQIIALESVLRRLEGRDYRDPELYFLSIFGDPTDGGTWGWRFEGHHLSLNFTIVNGRFIAAGPSFFGANPASQGEGEDRQRVLAAEEDLGRQLIMALPEGQRATATLAERAFGDIVTGNSRQVDIGEPAGLVFSAMAPEHQEMLRKLVEHYAHRLRPDLADQELAAIAAAGWDKVHFAWAGPFDAGQGHYYRMHGPTFLVEYDNTQNRANHVHTAWRDLRNDFGRDLIREHYQAHRDDAAHGHE